MTITTHNNFRLEVIRLLKLYNAGVLSFGQEASRTQTTIHTQASEIDPQEPVYLNGIKEDRYLIAGNMYELADKFKKRFQSNLREVLLVRLISALEVYLVDMVKEIFLKRKDLFHSGNKIEFNHGELLSSENITALWTKLINKECRKLQNQGFIETKKYYKNNFNIDFNNFKDQIRYIEFLHDQRHILVHRLGKVDKQFQLKYDTTNRNIVITNEDFYKATETIKEFGEFVLKEYNKLIEQEIGTNHEKDKIYSFIELYLLNDDGQAIISHDHTFIVEEQIVRVKDIIQSIDYNGSNVQIKLHGSPSHIKYYFKLLKGQQNAGNLKIENKRLSLKRNQSITKGDIKKVEKVLPETPYPVDIHKSIAAELKMSNSKVYEIIEMINKKSAPNKTYKQ